MEMFATKKEGKQETFVAQARQSNIPLSVGDVFVTDPALFRREVSRN
jgi:hypothetical protein